jgi:predicted ferric reductase
MSVKSETAQDVLTNLEDASHSQGIFLFILVILAGLLFALNIMPIVLPGLAFSTSGDTPKVFWFLSRGSAIAAYWVLWLAMAMGIIITNKMAQVWPGIPPAYEVHQYTSLFGMGLALFHAVILTGDHFIHYSIAQVLVPFGSQNYRPTWVGIGQTAFYIWVLVNLSFYIRKRIGKKAWRWIHFASYASFLGAMVHGIYSGTDTTASLVQVLYWISGASILVLTIYRVLIEVFPAEPKKLRAPAGPTARPGSLQRK